MADKTPNKPNKKAGSSLKEKRATKKAKKGAADETARRAGA